MENSVSLVDNRTCDYLPPRGSDVVYNPAHSHDNFHLFVYLNKYLPGSRLVKDAEVKQAVTSCLKTLDIDFFHARTKALVPQRQKCLMSVVNTWRSGVYHLLPMRHVYIEVRIKLPVSVCLVLYCFTSCNTNHLWEG